MYIALLDVQLRDTLSLVPGTNDELILCYILFLGTLVELCKIFLIIIRTVNTLNSDD